MLHLKFNHMFLFISDLGYLKKSTLILLTIFFLSCGPEKDSSNCKSAVTIKNSSEKIIYYSGASDSPQIPAGSNPLVARNYFKITQGASKEHVFGRDRGCYEDLFEENNNKLYYLIYDEQVLLNNSWEDVIANDMVLRRYSFTLLEMQVANWTITYNGN